jgi:hypothetical protein
MNKLIRSGFRIQPVVVLIALHLVLMLGGCHRDAPKAASATSHNDCQMLLQRLTDANEAERFGVIGAARSRIGEMGAKEVAAALTALRPKNVSTLIYVCIKTRNPVFYRLSPSARQSLENSPGSFPNIAYYYARVNPGEGLNALFGLYERHPDKRLPVCLAIGEVCQKEAGNFLLAEAKTVKTQGGMVTDMLSGLKHSCRSMGENNLDWFLAQSLDREELIVLSELTLSLPFDKIKTYWKSGGVKRLFAIELIMGQPAKLFDALCWMIDQYMKAGDTDTVRQLMMSDGMRSATSPHVQKFRRSTLNKLHPISPRGGFRYDPGRKNKQ